MADYTQITNFTAKDALNAGDPNKLIKGSQQDAELGAISTAIATKYDSTDMASTGEATGLSSTTKIISPGTLNDVLVQGAGMGLDIMTIADPGADAILGWDDAPGAAIAFTIGDGLETSTTTFQLATTIGGDGLTYSSGVLSVTDAAATGTNAVVVSSGVISLVPTSLTQLTGAGIAGNDELIMYDADAGANKAVQYQDFGMPVQTDATATIAPGLSDANTMYYCSSASAVAVTIPANASVAFPVGTVISFYQAGAGQITIGLTSDTLRSPNGAKTAAQYSVVSAMKVGATEWVIVGDATS